MTARRISAEALDLLKRWEGCVLHAYDDADPARPPRFIEPGDAVRGTLTIGYGHNLDANPISGLGEGSCITEDHAREILGDDIRIAAHQVAGKLPFAPALAPARFGVLVNMTFNLGISGLLGFSNTLADVERGDWASAARRMLQSKWAGQVGRRAHELAKQMETGQWQ